MTSANTPASAPLRSIYGAVPLRALLSAALPALAGGAWWLFDRRNGTEAVAPYCDGERMRPGDVCISFGGGGGSYEDLVADAEAARRISDAIIAGMIAIGLVLLLLVVVLWVADRRVDRHLKDTPPPLAAASSTVSVSLAAVIGAIVFGVGASYSLSTAARDHTAWYFWIIPAALALLGLGSLWNARPRSGRDVLVLPGGSLRVISARKVRRFAPGELQVRTTQQRPGNRVSRSLVLSGVQVVDLDGMAGADQVADAIARGLR